jgi:hypothetical protein
MLSLTRNFHASPFSIDESLVGLKIFELFALVIIFLAQIDLC